MCVQYQATDCCEPQGAGRAVHSTGREFTGTLPRKHGATWRRDNARSRDEAMNVYPGHRNAAILRTC